MTSHMPSRQVPDHALSRPATMAAIALLLTSFGMAATAETLYVDDTLRIGVRPEPDTHVASTTIVVSGTALEILEKKAGYSRVRTPSGQQGWVKSAYLTAQKASRPSADAAQQRIESLEKELALAQGSVKAHINPPTATATPVIPPAGTDNDGLRRALMDLERDKARLMQQVRDARASSATSPPITFRFLNWIDSKTGDANPSFVLLASIGVLLTGGFLIGITWHRRQVSRRLGGLRF